MGSMDSDSAVNVLPADEANPRFFNVTDFPAEKLEVTIDHKRTVRVQGEHTTQLEDENGVKKQRKDIINYHFELPEEADEQSITSEIHKGYISIGWRDQENKNTVAAEPEKQTSVTDEASSRKKCTKTPKQVRFQLPGFSDRPPRVSNRKRTESNSSNTSTRSASPIASLSQRVQFLLTLTKKETQKIQKKKNKK